MNQKYTQSLSLCKPEKWYKGGSRAADCSIVAVSICCKDIWKERYRAWVPSTYMAPQAEILPSWAPVVPGALSHSPQEDAPSPGEERSSLYCPARLRADSDSVLGTIATKHIITQQPHRSSMKPKARGMDPATLVKGTRKL